MIYLEKFQLLNEQKEAGLSIFFPSLGLGGKWVSVYDLFTEDEYYPTQIFPSKEFNVIDFDDITIFYGGNGSGKTTLLNIIAEKNNIFRQTPYLQTSVFHEYLKYCSNTISKRFSQNSKFLASDDIFNHIFTVRRENLQVSNKKSETKTLHNCAKDSGYYPQTIHFDDSDGSLSKFKEIYSARKMSKYC